MRDEIFLSRVIYLLKKTYEEEEEGQVAEVEKWIQQGL